MNISAMTDKNGYPLAGLKQTHCHRNFDKPRHIMNTHLSHKPVTVEFYGPLAAK
jgi:hypothetical protein